MKFDEFIAAYGPPTDRLENHLARWRQELEIDKWLNTSVMPGVLIGDLLVGDGLGDRIDPSLMKGFSELMGEKADTFYEIRAIILEKHGNSDASIVGLMNKIQGQIGENFFIEAVGRKAQLAENGSQIGWDVKVDHGDHFQYVQVKVYQDPNAAIRKMQEVNERISEGRISDVTSIDFAVNADIYQEVAEKAEALGLPNKVIDMGVNRDEIRDMLINGFTSARDYEPMQNFFSNLIGSTVSGVALLLVVNGFFLWKGTKEKAQAIDDTFYGSVVSAGGFATTYAIDEALAIAIGGPVVGALAIGAGLVSRSFLKRVADRRSTAESFAQQNIYLAGILNSLRPVNP